MKDKEFDLNETCKVIVSKKGRMTFYNFDECVLQLMSSEVEDLRKALEYITENNQNGKNKRRNVERNST